MPATPRHARAAASADNEIALVSTHTYTRPDHELRVIARDESGGRARPGAQREHERPIGTARADLTWTVL